MELNNNEIHSPYPSITWFEKEEKTIYIMDYKDKKYYGELIDDKIHWTRGVTNI